MLEVPNPKCQHISAAMSGLEQLETLWLADPGMTPQASGALQLSALQSLCSLALTGVVPESITCNDSCELHVVMDVESMEHPVWDSVLPHVRSVRLSGYSTHDPVALPGILLNASNLTRAAVSVNQCGTATAPLLLGGLSCTCGGSFPALQGAACRCAGACHLAQCLRGSHTLGFALLRLWRLLGRLSRPSASASRNCRCATANPSLYLFMAVTVSPAPNLLCCFPIGTSAVWLGSRHGKEAPGVDWNLILHG